MTQPFPLPSPPSLPPSLTGVRGITSRKNGIKDARTWVLKHFGHKNQHLYEPGFWTVSCFEFQINVHVVLYSSFKCLLCCFFNLYYKNSISNDFSSPPWNFNDATRVISPRMDAPEHSKDDWQVLDMLVFIKCNSYLWSQRSACSNFKMTDELIWQGADNIFYIKRCNQWCDIELVEVLEKSLDIHWTWLW